MKNRNYLIYLLFLNSFCLFNTQAQNLCDQVKSNFPIAISEKVYGILTKVPLTDTKQIELAKLFNAEDSLTKVLINNGSDLSLIDKVHADAINSFCHVLSNSEIDSYYTALLAKEAEKKAQALTSKERPKFNNDKTLESKFYQLQYNKYIEIGKLQKRYMYDNKLDQRIDNKVLHHDSIINHLLFCEGINVPNTDIFVAVRHKKKLGLSDVQVDSLVDKGCELENLRKVQVDNETTSINFKNIEKEVLMHLLSNKQYEDYLKLKFLVLSQKKAMYDWKELKEKKMLTHKTGTDSLYVTTAITNYYLSHFIAKEKYENQPDMLDKIYWQIEDSIPYAEWKLKISRRFLAKGAYNIFFTCIQHKDTLELSEGQIDLLGQRGFYLDERIRLKNKTKVWFDVKGYEHTNIELILNENQYDKLLVIRNRAEACQKTIIDWAKIKEHKLAPTSDSISQKEQITNYYLARLMATDRYMFNKNQKWANLNAIDQNIPNVLMKLRMVQKAEADTSQVSKDTKRYRGNFQW